MKTLKWIVIVIVILFAVIQIIRPARTNPPVDDTRTIFARLQVPTEVTGILQRSCQDCHSHKTVWPWYSQVAPVSWLLTSDVNDGRRHLNLSDWASYDSTRAAKKLDGMCDEVEQSDMPLWFYIPLHSNSKLSDNDKKVLCDWTKQQRQAISSTP